jgi:cysteine desulfurase
MAQQAPQSAPPRPCFLDANAGTPCAREVIDALVAWMNRGNTASEHASALEARALAANLRREIAVECAFELEGPQAYDVHFTSGGAESNALVLTGAVRSFAAKTKRMPHVVTSAADHPSVLDCCAQLEADRMCQLTVLAAPGGRVDPEALRRALRPSTCLVSILAASGDTGAANDLRALAQVARGAQVPFHSDAAQVFGRLPLRARALGLDAFSLSAHKFGGPPGVGALVVRRAFADGYGLRPQVFRGGTDNTPGLAATLAALQAAADARGGKNERLRKLCAAIRTALAARLRCFEAAEHPPDPLPSIDGGITPAPAPRRGSAVACRAIADADATGAALVFWVSPGDDAALPNTLALAVRQAGFCARAARAALERRGVIVGALVPGVADALGLPAALRAGVIRVSQGDAATTADVRRFIVEFLAIVDGAEAVDASRPARRARPRSPPSRKRRAP